MLRYLLAALAVVALPYADPAAAADYRVKDVATFHAALNTRAKSGDTILLEPGRYDGITSKYKALDFDPPVTIRSADPANPAVMGRFRVASWRGLTFTGLDWSLTPGGAPFEFVDCGRIVIDRVHIHGTLNGDPSDDPIGLGFKACDGVTVTNNEFQQLLRGVVVGSSRNVKVAGNTFHDLRSDGADFGQVVGVEVSGNRFRDFRPAGKDHPDAIQFNTARTTTPSTDIVIAGNLIEKGEGAYVQGVFLRDQVGTLPFERVTIRDNLMVGTGYNGIRVQGVKDLTLAGNELITFAGENNTFVLVQKATGVLSQGNRGVNIGFGTGVDASTGVVRKGDVVTKPMKKDRGAAARAMWLGRSAQPRPR